MTADPPPSGPCGPTAANLRRLRAARAVARARTDAAEAVRRAALADAFRAELGATVRVASPFLADLREVGERSIDAVAWDIAPAAGWPRRPRLSGGGTGKGRGGRHALRRWFVGGVAGGAVQGVAVRLDGGPVAEVLVAGHAVEVFVAIGAARFDTGSGTLRVRSGVALPETILAGVVGMPLDAVVDHAAVRGRGWTVASAGGGAGADGATLEAVTGVVPYRMPWAR